MLNAFLPPRKALAACLLLAGGALPVAAQAQLADASAPAATDRPGQTEPDAQPSPAALPPLRIARPQAPRSPYPAEAAGLGPRTGPNTYMLRAGEDWSFLADPKAKRDRFSSLKYMPLDADGDAYLTLNADQRSRYAFSSRPGLNDGKDRHEFLIRTTVAADLHILPAFRIYGELASAQIFGRNENVHQPIQENDLIIQQLFGEIRLPVAGGMARLAVGRQEYFDGPRFIISPRDNPNIHVSMNGARLSMDWRRFRFTAIDFTPTQQGDGWLDDAIGNGEMLRGVNSSFLVTDKPIAGRKAAIYFDPFYFHYENKARRIALISGEDRRENYGARLWGHVGTLSFDWTAIRQNGEFSGRAVKAHAFSTSQSIALGNGRTAPRLGFHADLASGGGNYSSTGTVHAFNFLYNATIMFSDDNYIGAINMMDIAPTLSVPLAKNVTLSTEAGFYWRQKEGDAVYRGNAQPYVGTQLVAGKQVAHIYRATLNWAINPHVSVAGVVNYVDAGTVLRRAGYGDNSYVSMTLKLGF